MNVAQALSLPRPDSSGRLAARPVVLASLAQNRSLTVAARLRQRRGSVTERRGSVTEPRP